LGEEHNIFFADRAHIKYLRIPLALQRFDEQFKDLTVIADRGRFNF
jgi:hypothetical protein